MSEILAAIPRLLSFRHRDDYAVYVRRAQADHLLRRSVGKTSRQLNDAYKAVVRDEQEKDDTGYSRP